MKLIPSNNALWLLVILLHCCLIGYSQKKRKNTTKPISIPIITSYSPRDYNGGIQNWGIDQDSTGYLYVANNFGLLEFDGASWKKYAIPEGTKSRCVNVHEKSNNIYVGGQNTLGFFAKTPSGLSYQSLTDHIPDEVVIDEVWKIVEFEGILFANISGQIVKIEGVNISYDQPISEIEFIAKVGNQLVAACKKGVYLYDRKTNNFNLLKGSKGYEYRGAINTEKGIIYFTYDGKILTHTNQMDALDLPITKYLSEAKVNRVLQLEDGRIAIGTQNDGLYILDNQYQMLAHLTKHIGLSHRTVISLYEDDFNNLWLGLNNGICAVDLNSPFSLINENLNVEGTGHSAINFNNSIFLGTSSGLFNPAIGSSEEVKPNYDIVSGSEGLVNNLSLFKDKLIVGHHEGSFLYDGKAFKQFFNEVGTWHYQQYQKDKLIGGSYSGFYVFEENNGLISKPSYLEGLNESSRIFEFEDDSTLWMTHGYKGAYKIVLANDKIKTVTHYGEKDGFSSNRLISVYRIQDELVFTADKGVYQFNEELEKFEPHPFLNQWFENIHVSKLSTDGDDTIYFIADGKAGVLKKKSIGIYEMEQRQFQKINHFLTDDLENINILENNEVLFGAKEGFIRYQPALDKPNTKPFNVHLKEVLFTYNEDSLEHVSGAFFEKSVALRPQLIRLEFSAPYFDGIEHLQYAYRLKPYEENWSEWTEANWKEYTNIPAGNYVFEVKAKNIYGEESNIRKSQFTIAPYWYESNTAYTIYIVATLVFFTLVFYLREKKHKDEKNSIHQSKDELIKTKEREINDFSTKSTERIQSLKNENLKKEIEHKNNELASVTMHLLSKNEFVSSIRKKINDIIESGDHQSLRNLLKSIDRNINEEDAWNTFVHHFDQVHGNFLKKIQHTIQLTPQETKLCAYLKMNMSTKDIANLMNITVRGVELARYRLRKKLKISRGTNLIHYLEKFEN